MVVSTLVNKTPVICSLGTAPRLSDVDSFSITINGSQIKQVSEFKYLGVVLDERLSWNDHIKYLLTNRVGILGRIRYTISYSSANTIYTFLIRPIIEYCDSVWGCCGQVNSRSMEALQRRAARILMKTTDNDSAMDNLKWPTLEHRRRKHILNLVEKCIKGHCP